MVSWLMLHCNKDKAKRSLRGPGMLSDICKTVAKARLAAVLAFALPLVAGGEAQAETDFSDEIHCLALNIYFEARSEPELGQIAVGHVVMNRMDDPRFPSTVCSVVNEGAKKRNRCQFSWMCDGRSDRPRDAAAWKSSKLLAHYIYWGFSQDPTHGALWYHADYVKPVWRKALLRGPEIGRHIFYLNAERKGREIASAPLPLPRPAKLEAARVTRSAAHVTRFGGYLPLKNAALETEENDRQS